MSSEPRSANDREVLLIEVAEGTATEVSDGRGVAMTLVDLALAGSDAAVRGFKSEFYSLVAEPQVRTAVLGLIGIQNVVRSRFALRRPGVSIWPVRKGLRATLRSNLRAFQRVGANKGRIAAPMLCLFFLVGLHRLKATQAFRRWMRSNLRAYFRSKSRQAALPRRLAGIVIYGTGVHRITNTFRGILSKSTIK